MGQPDRLTLDKVSLYLEECIMGLIRFNKDIDLKSALVKNYQQLGIFKAKCVFIINNPIAKDWDNAKETTFEIIVPGIDTGSLDRAAESVVNRARLIVPNRLEDEE